jgi:hypothetical protein
LALLAGIRDRMPIDNGGVGIRFLQGLSQDWGSGSGCHGPTWIIGWLELLSEAGAERAIADDAVNLEQQVGAASRPAHLL